MSIETANLIVTAMGLYFATGLIVALAFVFLGVQKIDPAAETMPTRARVLILPGAIVLWPLMALKWVRQTEPPLQ